MLIFNTYIIAILYLVKSSFFKIIKKESKNKNSLIKINVKFHTHVDGWKCDGNMKNENVTMLF